MSDIVHVWYSTCLTQYMSDTVHVWYGTVFKRPNLDSIYVCFHELTSASYDYASVYFHACLIVCTYMFLNPITFESYNLNIILITNVSTGTHKYNVQT